MEFPTVFPLHDKLTHKSPDLVRTLASQRGFHRHEGSSSSEIWYMMCGRGYAIIRIDAAGHLAREERGDTPFSIGGIAAGVHGGVPHYHKEWISFDLFHTYLQKYVPQVVRYNDFGQPETGGMNDGVAKRTHLRR